ncbi:MAG: hypothetical protein IPK60_25590 [Sandaracinaceae bacterium]|nr:hypothetical protein [Sandaracinaceae bacterium]
MNTRAGLIVIALLLASPSVATADNAVASAQIERGMTLRNQGHIAEALAAFEQANDLERTPHATAQIGLTEAMLQHWARAHRALAFALSTTNDAWVNSRRAVLDVALTRISARVGFVSFLGCDVGSHVFANGQDVAALPLASPLALDVGEAVIAVRGPNADEQRFRVVAGETTLFHCIAAPPEADRAHSDAAGVRLPRAPLTESNRTRPEPDEAAARSTMHAWGVAGIVTGAIGLGVGVGFHINREVEAANANDCSNADCYLEHQPTASRSGVVAIIGYSVGGAALAAGVLLLILAPTRPETTDSAWLCAPTVDILGAACRGRF